MIMEIDTATFHADKTLKYFSKIKKDSLFLWPYNMSSDSAYVWAKVGQRCDSILIKKDNLKRTINILPLSSDYLKDSEKINHIAKFENYIMELKKILSILKIDNKEIKNFRKTKKVNHLITPKFIEKVNLIYKIDFIKYNYKMIVLTDSIRYNEFLKIYFS